MVVARIKGVKMGLNCPCCPGCSVCDNPTSYCVKVAGLAGTYTDETGSPVYHDMSGNYTLGIIVTTAGGFTSHNWNYRRSPAFGSFSAATGATGPAAEFNFFCYPFRLEIRIYVDASNFALAYGASTLPTAADLATLCSTGTLTLGLVKNGLITPNTYPNTISCVITRGACPAYMAAPMMGMAPPPATATPQAPTSRHAVVTLAVGQKGRDLLAVSGPLMQAAANRWGADFRVITGEDTDFNIGEKLRLFDYLKPYPDGYDRVFYINADALILPSAPNPFEAFPPGRPYASDDLVGQPKAAEWIDRENREVCESQGWEWGGPFLTYWNSGVWLVDAAHAPAFEPPAKPYPVYHCSEQHAVNERMRSGDFGVADFGRAWNWQWWVESKMDPPPGTHVLHFSGMDPITNTDAEAHGRRLALMRRFATRKLPLECVHLQARTEFRAGCGGAFCQHSCSLGLPAVPGGYCQTCPSYDAGD